MKHLPLQLILWLGLSATADAAVSWVTAPPLSVSIGQDYTVSAKCSAVSQVVRVVLYKNGALWVEDWDYGSGNSQITATAIDEASVEWTGPSVVWRAEGYSLFGQSFYMEGFLTKTVTVLAGNNPPQGGVTVPSTLTVGQNFTVSGSVYDADGDLHTMGIRWQNYGLQGGDPGQTWWNISGSSATRITPTLTAPPPPGTNYFRIEVWDQANNSYAGPWMPVDVYGPQAAVAISPANPGPIYVGDSITFTASGGSGVSNYTWGGAASGTGSSKTVTFNSAGSHSVTVYNPANGFYVVSNAANAPVAVNKHDQNTVSISPASATVTVGSSLTFYASGGSGTGSYTWGGDASGTGSSKTVVFNTIGSRSVTVYRKGDATYLDSDQASATITVTPVAPTYTLTVQNGSPPTTTGLASGSAQSISANTPVSGMAFDSWTLVSGSGSFANANASSTTFTIGAGNATVRADYRDVQAPTVPSGLIASDIAATSFTLSWNASTDNVGVAGYRVRQNGSALSEVTGTSRNITGLAPCATYQMTVEARDAAQNWSVASSSLSVTTPPNASVATAATNVSGTGFTANWNVSTGATSYRLDVSTSSSFSTYVSGYQNLDVGNVTARAVTGLSGSTTYYYRVRAVYAGISSASSNTITAATGSGGPQTDTSNQNELNIHLPTTP